MRWFDPARPRGTSGLPLWLDASELELPALTVAPQSEGRWQIAVWNGRRWVEIDQLSWAKLIDLLKEWERNPERVLHSWFQTTIGATDIDPKLRSESARTVDKTAKELGLD